MFVAQQKEDGVEVGDPTVKFISIVLSYTAYDHAIL